MEDAATELWSNSSLSLLGKQFRRFLESIHDRNTGWVEVSRLICDVTGKVHMLLWGIIGGIESVIT